jgi:hypothetical protein
MARTPEQNAAYMRRYRRKKRLEKLGFTPDPHAACDDRLLVESERLKQALARIRELERDNATLREELEDPLRGAFK